MTDAKPGFKLSQELTEQLIAEVKSNFKDEDGEGFIQITMTKPDGTTLLGIDGRAGDRHCEQPQGKILEVVNTTLIFSSGSCRVTVVRNGKLETWELPHWFCPDHSH